ncbi:phosphoglycerate dehydrogenase [Glycomyces sp. TRM65418]|uniref:phosphoglycerate dehydrogenase n=1 Tax=Glycomyces sp. TRM65418 TaxID=2867006 RepID=UPI001CE5ED0E|nr:phosphoglycerate dehydrogenase [Glycomyces sp. TRM65418]MCC3764474.1 phosphoglycerate dehydrogenase [Glycomyces sp. TRM65418]QZD54147.1 phosphoglycerate dehydrogenase [Glycomyces sp. TRM65418]
MRVLVTTPTFGAQSPDPWSVLSDAGIEAVRPGAAHPLDAGALAREAEGCDALIVGLDDVRGAVLESPTLKVIAKHGVGVDNIDVEAAAAKGITVVNAPGSNAGGVADLTFALILAVARRLPEADASCRRGEWHRFPGIELAGKTLAILGYGRIGRAVAMRAKAFGLNVVAYDPFVPADAFGDHARPVGLDEALAAADIVSLHLPGGGPPVLDREALESLRAGTIVVNAARGDLVDETALAELLETGRLGGAALDATAVEPLPADSPLLRAPNLILTPHIGAQTDLANRAMGVLVAEDVVRVLRGATPRNPVAPKEGHTP